MIHIEQFTFNSFQTRCSVVWDDTLECAIVDPGCSSPSEIAALTSFIDGRGLKPVCIMLTHGHFDHVLGVAELASLYGRTAEGSDDHDSDTRGSFTGHGPDCPVAALPIYMHPADRFTLENNEYFCKWFGAPLPAPFETVDVREAAGAEGGCPDEGCSSLEGCGSAESGDHVPGAISTVKVGGLRFNVIETPGHTVGGVCYFEPTEKVLFSGDTLFAGAIGRTDHPGGDYDQLMKSILGKLMVLDVQPSADGPAGHTSVTVIPGHGPCTDIAREGMTNPFLLPFNEPYDE